MAVISTISIPISLRDMREKARRSSIKRPMRTAPWLNKVEVTLTVGVQSALVILQQDPGIAVDSPQRRPEVVRHRIR